MKMVEVCEGCYGTGMRAPAGPSCILPPIEKSWFVVERCDNCERFSDDLAAASQFPRFKWIMCETGGWHAIATAE